ETPGGRAHGLELDAPALTLRDLAVEAGGIELGHVRLADAVDRPGKGEASAEDAGLHSRLERGAVDRLEGPAAFADRPGGGRLKALGIARLERQGRAGEEPGSQARRDRRVSQRDVRDVIRHHEPAPASGGDDGQLRADAGLVLDVDAEARRV